MKKGIIVVFLAILCTLLLYGVRYMQSPLHTKKAVYGTYEESVYTDCYFVRDEKVYSADIAGTVYNHFSDGMRAGNHALISTIYDGAVNDEVLQELRTIDKKIEDVRSLNFAVNYNEDDSNLENRIENFKTEIISAAVKNDIKTVSAYKDAVLSLRKGISRATSTEMIEMLMSQKNASENKIGGVKQDIYAETSGVFSTVLDGMEHILTPEKVKQYTVSDFNNISPATSKTSNQTVNKGDSVCKIVNNHIWYVLCAVASERLEGKKVGSSVSMRFDNIPGVEVSGKIANISDLADGKKVLLIETAQYVEGAYSMRSSPMELVFKSYSGYMVPVYAVRTQEGQKGVIGRRNNVERFYPCDIIYTNESTEYVIIKTPEEAERKLEDVDEFVLGER